MSDRSLSDHSASIEWSNNAEKYVAVPDCLQTVFEIRFARVIVNGPSMTVPNDITIAIENATNLVQVRFKPING
jgi:hypothetical protein